MLYLVPTLVIFFFVISKYLERATISGKDCDISLQNSTCPHKEMHLRSPNKIVVTVRFIYGSFSLPSGEGFSCYLKWRRFGLWKAAADCSELCASSSSTARHFPVQCPLLFATLSYIKKDVCYLLNQLYDPYPEKHKHSEMMSREAGEIQTLNVRQCHSYWCPGNVNSLSLWKLELSWGGEWQVPRGMRNSEREL